MPPPLLVMVAGPNGAGKTTLVRSLHAAGDIALPGRYINADDLRAERGLDDRDAQALAERLRVEAIAQRHSLLYETVMSHPSKIAELQTAAQAGYTIVVVYVATGDPGLNVERVRLRVAAGGHPVPEERIRARHRRSVALAPAAIGFATHAYVYDNSDWGTDAAQQLQAAGDAVRLQAVVKTPAPWVSELIRRVGERAAELEAFFRAVKEPLAVPNLDAGVVEGPVRELGKHYVLQADRLSGNLLLHDQLLLSKPVLPGRTYRIDYAQGVSKVVWRPGTKLRAVKPARP